MANCNVTLNGMALDCEVSQGGIRRVFIAPWKANAVSGDTLNVSDTKFKTYEFRKNTGSMTSTLTADEVAGTRYYTTELSLVFTRMDATKRAEINALIKAQAMVVVEDGNGMYHFLGADEYVSASAGGGATGTNKGDSSNYSITLKDESRELPPIISFDPSTMADVAPKDA